VSLFVKICGVTDLATATAAADAGADAIGFVFAVSPRQVSPQEAVAIAGEIPPRVLRVAVFRRPERSEIEAVLERFTPDLVQADHDTLIGLEDVDVLPVFRVDAGASPEGGRFLYEGPVSGAGQMIDLDGAADVARLGDMVLAGGLRPDNVGRAIDRVRPYGVDVSSGVETAPGEKDPALIRSFVAATRAAQERLVRT
jgi:phosphoribosylanthranilate isomerase